MYLNRIDEVEIIAVPSRLTLTLDVFKFRYWKYQLQ